MKLKVSSRSSASRSIVVKAGGALAAVLVLTAVAWVPSASAAVSGSVSIVSTGTGGPVPEDHAPTGIQNPGDDLSTSDLVVRTLDATRVNLSYTPDPGGSTNLRLTATIMSGNAPFQRAGWDLRFTNYGSSNGQCPGGVSTPNRWTLVCQVGASNGTTPVSLDPILRVSALAGDNAPFRVDVTVDDANSSVSASSPTILTSAAPRFDLEKTVGNATQTATSFVNEGIYSLKVGDADPLGISALTDPVTFTDQVDANARIIRCDDTTPVTFDQQPYPNPDTQLMQIVGTCNGAGFPVNNTQIDLDTTGLTNGQDNNVSMSNIEWDRIYPPPTIPNISDQSSGFVVATMQFFMETDKLDIANNGGNLKVGNAIGMTSYNSATDQGIGPSVWNPSDQWGQPNLGSDESAGEDDLNDNTATYTHNLYLEATQGKYVSELTVDGQLVTTDISTRDGGTVSWPTEIDLCDKFDNRRQHVVQAPNSSEAVVNLTDPNATVFANATVQYARSSGWGPGAGPTSTQWWNMSQSGCDAADVVGGTFYTSSQVDWSNSGGGSIDANEINMVRYLPSGPYVSGTFKASYDIRVHFKVANNNDGDYIVDYSSFDPDGPNGPTTWDASSCVTSTPGSCPDPPVLDNNNANYRPGPTASSGVMIHVDSHPTVGKFVIGTNVGTTPIDFRYEVNFGNTQVVGDTTPRQTFTVRDVLPPHFSFVPGTFTIQSNPAGLGISAPTVTTQGNNIQVLTWTISGLTLDVAPSSMPRIRYTTRADEFAPPSGSAGYINRATISGPGILDGLTAHWSPSSAVTPAQFLGLGTVGLDGLMHSRWGLFAEARVDINGAGRMIMRKGLDAPTSEPGSTFNYDLLYSNAGGDVERMDAYDILPFDGDGTRGSVMHGDIELLSVTEDPGSDVDIWISDTAPATLDALDAGSGSPVPGGIDPTVGGLPAVGSPTWPCRIQQAGVGLCPALSAVTAIRIVGTDPNPGASGGADSFLPSGAGPFTISLAVRSVGGRGGDEFHNNWAAEFPPLGTPGTATAPAHTLTEGAIGDRVFKDVNENGIFDTGDAGIANVTVRVFDASNTVVGSAQTDANGRWLVDHLRPGNYRIRIPSSEFQPGAPLAGFEVVPGGAPDPDANVDETLDHDAHEVSGGVEAGDRVTLSYGTEPLLDDPGSLTFLRDSDTNLTVDFALVHRDTTTTTTTTSTTTSTSTPNTPTTTTPGAPPRRQEVPPRGTLPRTGWESFVWILVGGSLILGGAMVVSRRQDRRA